MSDSVIYIPFPRALYDDIVRFSDGRLSPEDLAADLVENWVSNSVEFGFGDHWGDRIEEVAQIYTPHVYEKWQKEDAAAREKSRSEHRPLIWKGLTIDAGTEVRMSYGGQDHYAKVKGGRIVDDDGAFSPSEWASKVAGGTSRNAWRDLWFREPLAKHWIPAQMMRAQAQQGAEE